LVSVWLTAVGFPARAGVASFAVATDQKRQVLDGHVEVIFDRTWSMELAAVQGSADWTAVGPRPYVKGLDRGVVWFRARIHNPTSMPVDRLLQISSGLVDEMTVWVTDGSGTVRRFEAGEDVALSDRVVDDFFPLFPVSLEPGEEVVVHARLVDEGTLNVGLSLSDRDAVRKYLGERQWRSGLMTGVFSLVFLYAMVVYRRIRDPMMGWMAALALASLFQWLTTHGTELSLLVPVASRGWTTNRLIIVGYELTAFCAFYFYITACQIDRHHPVITRVVKGFGWLGLVNAVAVFVLPYVLAIRILYLGVIGLVIVAGTVVWRVIRGDRIAKRLVLAVGVVLLGYLSTLLTEEGFLPRTWWSGYFVPITSMLQWVLLSEALAFRVRQIEEQRLAAREAQKAEELRTEQIRTAFGRYVAPDLAAKLLDDPEALALGGRMQTITILMSDLRGFTGLTDRLGPPAMCALLNDYLGRMTEVIEGHGGMVNEFIGDAILTLFGTPLQGAEDELDACRCAIEMQIELEKMNEELAETHGLRLEMGIGIHTGEAVVGNIGSDRRVKWGVIGDPVNMTGRIESLTVGTQVLISAELLARVEGRVGAGPVRSVQVKGRSRTLEVAELRSILGEVWTMPQLPDPQSQSVRLEGAVQVFDGKALVGEDHAVDVVELGRSEVTFQCARSFREGTDLALRVRKSDVWTSPIYAKVCEDGSPMADGRQVTRATITWMEPEVRASLLETAC